VNDRLEQLLEDVLESTNELRQELRRLRTGELVARLSDADREEIANQVFERVDERLAPLDDTDTEGSPRPRARGGYFKR
jgi:hypothetical protein